MYLLCAVPGLLGGLVFMDNFVVGILEEEAISIRLPAELFRGLGSALSDVGLLGEEVPDLKLRFGSDPLSFKLRDGTFVGRFS